MVVRLIAAASVIFSHAFLIAEGSEKREPLSYLLGPGNILGLYGVFTFFIISGFLLARSLSLNSNLIQFSVNRILRIYPAFLFSTLVTVLVIGAALATEDFYTYLTQSQTRSYILNSLECLCDAWNYPFSFAQSTLPTTINGSLWTLSYEILSYVFLMWLWMVFRKPAAVAVALSIAALFTILVPYTNSIMAGIAYTLPYFAGGVVMFVFVSRFGTNGWVALTSLALLCLSAFLGMQHYAFSVFGAYLVVFIGERQNPGSSFARRFGDWSYGLYLFGWPIEQVVKQLSLTNNGLLLFLYSLPLALGVAAISWFAVEKPSLGLKKRLGRLLSLGAQPGFARALA